MENTTFDDWMKLDIRVGTIKEATPHPDADKLTILKIDEGKEELRQLVAGIKEQYSEEELVGKKIIFLANLEPKELRGQLSQGMILAAVDGDQISLLTVDKDIPNNAKVQ
jgi:methionyl-tRNA synthetase